MTISTFASGTKTATGSGTEDFLSSPNVVGKFSLDIDRTNMAAGDVLLVRVYKIAIAGGSPVVTFMTGFSGAPLTDDILDTFEWFANSLTDTNALRFSITQTKGTGRAFPWKVTLHDDGANVTTWLGTAVTAATAGIPDVNAKRINNVATTSVTTINANQGMTQPMNFTGTGASALVKSDAIDLAGQVITAAAGVTFPTSVASPTNITGGTITTVGTLTTYTGNTPQTGDSYARIGAAGAGLTALGDTRIANLDATISSRTKPADTQAAVTLVTTATNLTNAPTAGDFTATMKTSAATATQTGLTAQGYTSTRAGYLDTLNGLVAAVWASATRLLTAGTNIVLAKGTGVTGFNDLDATGVENAVWDATLASHLTAGSTGAALNSAGSAGDPWGTALPGAYGAGSAGNIIGNNLDATISSRTKPADTQAAVTLVATTTNLTNLPAAPTDWLTAAAVKADAVTKVQSGLATPTNITAGTITTTTNLTNAPPDSTGVGTLLTRLSAARAGYLDTLNGIVAAIWAAVADSAGVTTLLARLTATRAGYLDNLNYTYTAPDNTTIGAINTKLGTPATSVSADIAALNDFNPASDVVAHVTLVDTTTDVTNSSTFTIDDTTGNKIADYVWRRSSANIELSASGDTLSARSGYGVIAWLTHKKSTVGATLTVTKSNDTTTLTTAALTSDVAAEPVTGIDPA